MRAPRGRGQKPPLGLSVLLAMACARKSDCFGRLVGVCSRPGWIIDTFDEYAGELNAHEIGTFTCQTLFQSGRFLKHLKGKHTVKLEHFRDLKCLFAKRAETERESQDLST